MVEVMIRISVDVIWSSKLLLNRISKYNVEKVDNIYLANITPVNTDLLIKLGEKCGWLNFEKDRITISKRGKEIVEIRSFCDQAKCILEDYIKCVVPTWCNRIPYGRKEALIFMSKDEQASFYEAGLMENDKVSIEWWDNISAYIRDTNNKNKNDVGRSGEQETLLYEKQRTGYDPVWIAIESNLAGYDILSRCSHDNISRLLIEVKTSELSIDHADFYVTSNEWHTACNTKRYLFYIWSFYNRKRKLAVLEPEQIQPYIPTNNRTGEWQSVRIPFASFEFLFKEIT